MRGFADELTQFVLTLVFRSSRRRAALLLGLGFMGFRVRTATAPIAAALARVELGRLAVSALVLTALLVQVQAQLL